MLATQFVGSLFSIRPTIQPDIFYTGENAASKNAGRPLAVSLFPL